MHRSLALASLLVLSAGSSVAVAQAVAANGQRVGQASSPSVTAPSRLASFVAGEVTRIALIDVRGIQEPRASDYGITLSILNLAQSLSQGDESIARRRSEAAWLAGDSAELAAATEDIVRADPSDTVAVLRALTTRIGAMQMADERLAAYDRAVASNLDASIRSRMAMDAAMLLKERGDEAGFVQRLKQATQLDSTNKEAALLAFNFFSERSSDPMGRLELASNLLLADPLDIKTHELIRNELAAAGAWRSSARFHRNVASISRASRIRDDGSALPIDIVYKWRIDGVRATLDDLNQTLSQQRRNVEEGAGRQGIIRRPEDVRLGEVFEELRLCAALVSQRPNDVQASLSDMTVTLQRTIDTLRDPTRRAKEVTPEQAADALKTAAASQTLWHCLVAVIGPASETPAGAPGAAPAAPVSPAFVPAPEGADMPVVKGWLALRDKDYANAAAILEGAGTSLWAQLGRAMVLHQTVNNGESARAMTEVAKSAPLTALGTLADWLAESVSVRDGGGSPVRDPAAFEAFEKGIPTWIDDMAGKPHTFQSMRAEPVVNSAGNLDPIKIRVRIKNLSPVPLGVGAARTINSRLLFIPSMTRQGGAALLLEPEVIELDRRLRLESGKEMVYEVWPEVGMVGFAVQQNAYFPSRLRWRVIQGFEATSATERRPGLGCVESQIDTPVLHESLPQVRMKGDDLVAAISSAEESKLPELMVAARIRLLIGADPALDRLVDALVRRIPTLSVEGRLLALATLPASTRVPVLTALDPVFAADKDPRVLMLACLIRITAPDDPLIAAALATGDADAVRVANGIKNRFERHLKPQDATPKIEPSIPADQMPKPEPVPEKMPVGVPQPIPAGVPDAPSGNAPAVPPKN